MKGFVPGKSGFTFYTIFMEVARKGELERAFF
jgi:hypothetical protein